MTKEEKAAYMHAYKKRMRVAKEKGVDPKTLTLSDFYDDEVSKQKRLETEKRLDDIHSNYTGNERKAETLRKAARNYYARHKKESKKYYRKNREHRQLTSIAWYYGDVDTARKKRRKSAKKYYWKNKNNKSFWKKLKKKFILIIKNFSNMLQGACAIPI